MTYKLVYDVAFKLYLNSIPLMLKSPFYVCLSNIWFQRTHHKIF